MSAGFRHEIKPITTDWQTPAAFIEALGPFDMDPCASYIQHHPTAARMYCLFHDGSGLMMKWPKNDSVWLNPPYDRLDIAKWIERLADHGNGIALIYSRTDTNWFQDHVLFRAKALYFIRQRVKFISGATGKISGRSSAPCVLVAYGSQMSDRLLNLALRPDLGIPGSFVKLRS